MKCLQEDILWIRLPLTELLGPHGLGKHFIHSEGKTEGQLGKLEDPISESLVNPLGNSN